MEIHLPKIENWYSLNEKVHQALGLPADVSVRVFHGLHHAAFEIAQGTATFLSHKRSVGWLKGQTYGWATVMPYLYKEAFGVQPLSLKNPNIELKAWADSLKKDTSFVMMNEDHPLTGEVYNLDELDSALNDKKIFSFKISHRKHCMPNGLSVRPQSVLLCEVSEKLAFAVLGAKFKSPVQISAHFSFDEKAVIENILNQRKTFNESREAIEKFKAQLPEGFQVFSEASEVLADRILIWNPEINGEALVQELKLGSEVVALNSCAQGFADLEWWEGKPFSEQLRGLLMVSVQAVQKLTGTKLLAEAASRCRI